MDLMTVGQMAKPVIFFGMSTLSVFSLFLLAYIERCD